MRLSFSISYKYFLLIACVVYSCTITAQYDRPKQAFSKKGMVVTAHPVASQVGKSILEKGGNAIDAMVAVHFALAVVYQRAGNIGGGGFMLYRKADTKEVFSLDFREKAPALATKDMFLDSLGNVVPNLNTNGHLASGTPGSVDGMWQAHQKFGTMPWADLIQPAIEIAENGVLLTNYEARTLNELKPIFDSVNRYPIVFVKDSLWKRGDTLIQLDLANTLKIIQKEGKDGFYKGHIADLLVEEMLAKGGLIRHEDLENYSAVWRKAIDFNYKDYKIFSMPPPSSGGILLAQLFGMISHYPLAKYGFQKPAAVHLMVEAERRAYADRAAYIADPDFVEVPTEKLLDAKYIKNRIADFNPNKASKSATIKGGLKAESEETTHYSITDADGNAISVTTTVNTNYGSKVVVKNAGFILNNEMDDFAARSNAPNHFGLLGGKANAIAPNKRMLSSMTPTIVEKSGNLYLILGTPGGSTIPTTIFQVLVNHLVFGKSLKEAVNAHRFHHQHQPDKIQYEKNTFNKSTINALKNLGHKVEIRKVTGQVEAILLHSNGIYEGVADRRSDDTALGVD